MSGARSQAGKPQAVEQIIHAHERILDAEFLLENLPGLFGSQRADTVCLGGACQEPFLERLFSRRR